MITLYLNDLLNKPKPQVRYINNKLSPIQQTIFGDYLNFKNIKSISYDIDILEQYNYGSVDTSGIIQILLNNNDKRKYNLTISPIKMNLNEILQNVDIYFINNYVFNSYEASPITSLLKRGFIISKEKWNFPEDFKPFNWYDFNIIESNIINITNTLIETWENVINYD